MKAKYRKTCIGLGEYLTASKAPFVILICRKEGVYITGGMGVAAAGGIKVYLNLDGSQENRLLLNKHEKLAVFGFE